MYSRYSVSAAATYCSICDEGQRLYQDQGVNITQPNGCHVETDCSLHLALFRTEIFASDFEKVFEKKRTNTAYMRARGTLRLISLKMY